LISKKDLKQATGNVLSYVAVGLIVVLSLVPLKVLLLFSPALAFLLHRVIRYRKHVVTSNLRKAFPDKDHAWIASTKKAFYLHFSDLFFETISLLSSPKKAVFRRSMMSSEGAALLDSLYREGKTVISLSGHFGNWEYQVPSAVYFKSLVILPVYRPLRNKAFDWLLATIRRRFAGKLVTDRQVARTMVTLSREKTPGAFGLVADQSPDTRHAYWLDFLNQDTAVFSGPEKMARSFKVPVVFIATRKVSRGVYRVHCELIAMHPEELPEGEVTRRFFSLLEQEIIRSPENYLWTHRRWKHKRD
jgi:Kdo2-lipid IVA lauroyltransferase/acyltransferase